MDTVVEKSMKPLKNPLIIKALFLQTKHFFMDIADFVQLHVMEKVQKKPRKKLLKWVHIAISNAKKEICLETTIKLKESIFNSTSTNLSTN